MSSETQRPFLNGSIHHHRVRTQSEIEELNAQLVQSKDLAGFHGDALIGDKRVPKGFLANLQNSLDDFRRILTFKNAPDIGLVIGNLLSGHGLDVSLWFLRIAIH